jgi:hypothetical protein
MEIFKYIFENFIITYLLGVACGSVWEDNKLLWLIFCIISVIYIFKNSIF